jgi:hypothetical protein
MGRLLTAHVIWETLRYEVVHALFGFRGVYEGLRGMGNRKYRGAALPAICAAVDLVACFYWKKILCLQRSVITARVMHAYGIGADVVIGYRFSPFFSHAWVEVDGRVVNDSTGLPDKLQILERVRPSRLNNYQKEMETYV